MTKLTYSYRHPTPEELYAVELEARRLRAEAMAEAFAKALAAVKGLFDRPAVSRKMRHA